MKTDVSIGCSLLLLLALTACGNQTTPQQVSTYLAAPTVSDTTPESNDSIWILPSENNESDTYLEELREHSPNENYLPGFDEDVDDVHDMELYFSDPYFK